MRRSTGAPPRCWRTTGLRRSITRGLAPAWWSAKRPTGRSRWRKWSTSRSRFSTSPAPKSPRKSPGRKARGLKVWGETCPQYFVLSADHMDRPGLRGRQVHVQSSPARRRGQRGAVENDPGRACWMWLRPIIAAGATKRRSASGCMALDAPFRDIPNGVPGLGSRLPILFSEGVSKGRIDPCAFVRLTVDQSRAAVRAVSAQGHHRARRGRGPGAVGREEAGHYHQPADAAHHRLHAVRGAGGDRLARLHHPPRRGGDEGRHRAGRTRQRPVPGARRRTT